MNRMHSIHQGLLVKPGVTLEESSIIVSLCISHMKNGHLGHLLLCTKYED